MSSELETPSEGVDESEKRGYEEPEWKNHAKQTDLSELLKDGTKESHDRAENTQFVKDFLKGHIKKDLFKLATTALYFTYSALEEEMDRNKSHPAFAPLYFPTELHRKEALTKDMEYFFGEDWREKVKCSEATQHYVDRIHYVGQHEPELLVAHAYTRYMGDLSGGQVLKKVAQRMLKLPSTGEGTQFYLFENIDNAQQFKQFYRARMNALDLDLKIKEKIVEEANKAFEYNMQIFNELDKAGSLLAKESQDGELPIHDGKGDVRKCPYYAAQQGKGAHEGSACPFKNVMVVLRQPNLQLVLAAVVALASGLMAWYFM
ncbi:heme oxygenase 2 isoform X1 [Sarcophilus harrisii]|uniref:heme oxygenase 2 isoform X1 n=1 Tax=Sarcophilus harrisii TaxID=9305 RepID=UPI001301D23A|nr:heme oxygenase 2 isoform X1 [Sarcophilus harrisii]XP_012398460.2 heme oxygenase 2 isoform X1 [Sarcophilus harrisii]XP_012398461.2 heme oxygenase 2 isoform X1 [Sarcophilus harrisii]XP_023353380.2 heme oxygenase 2 isoform X1 [Sarcophilus harrisii]XP_023353381.2 heme oxygenase 2 isoform X1 [Sarcophilus harrisii]XP_031801137.1 heme oxygenase 2 isoform X1 [Sarcophilus harrisii]XP_031801138.1 heme oxygenase 2 isoform X1 [Sarcophilus harrisii]